MKKKTQYVKVPLKCVRNLTPAQLQLWATIASFAPTYTVTIYTLCKYLKKDRTTLVRHLRAMAAKDYVTPYVVDYNNKDLIGYKANIPDE